MHSPQIGMKRALDHQDNSRNTVGLNNNNNNNNNSKRKLVRTQSPTATTIDRSSSSTSTEPTTVCSLPMDVWFTILKHLPLRHVLTLALVSREFLAHIFNMPKFWIYVHRTSKTPINIIPSPKEASTALRGLACRQLIMNQMATMCDYCYMGTAYTVADHGHLAVLPVRISCQDTSIRRRRFTVYLCGSCRIRHYQRHPEPVYEDTRRVILTKDAMAANYCIQPKDITYLLKKDTEVPRDSDAYIRLYARCIYGGDVGIDAEKQRFGNRGNQ